MRRARKEWTRQGRMLLFDGAPIAFLQREVDDNGNAPVSPHRVDLLAKRIVRLLNAAPRRAP